MQAGDRFIELGKQLQAFAGDARGNHAAVGGVAGTGGEAAFFQAIEETGDVGIASDHAVANFAAGKAAWTGSAEDAKDVVLDWGKLEGTEEFGFLLQERIRSTKEIEEGLLFEGLEGL